MKAIVNFSDKLVTVTDEVIPSKSALFYEGKQRKVFDAAANAKLL